MTQAVPPTGNKPAVVVQQGKLLDFIDRTTQRNETPEEYVRQEIAKSLVREYATLAATSPSSTPSASARASHEPI
jgi:hypothetical protein